MMDRREALLLVERLEGIDAALVGKGLLDHHDAGRQSDVPDDGCVRRVRARHDPRTSRMRASLGPRRAASIAVAPSSIPNWKGASVTLWLSLVAQVCTRSPSSSESAAARSSGSRLPARWVAGIRQNESTGSAESRRGILRRGGGLAWPATSIREVSGDFKEVGRQARCIIAQSGHRKSPAGDRG